MTDADIRLIDASPLPYLMSTPVSPAAFDETWPVLFFLHGYDEAAPLEIHEALTRHGPLHPGNPSMITEKFLVVAPQLPSPGGDVWFRYADTVRQIVTEVQVLFNGDPHRTYLTGFSFGGNGVFDLGRTQQDLWAALWPTDPTRVPETVLPRPVWLSAGAAARRSESRFVQYLDLTSVTDTVQSDRIYLDQGADHVGSARLAYGDERIYRWLLSRSFPAAA